MLNFFKQKLNRRSAATQGANTLKLLRPVSKRERLVRVFLLAVMVVAICRFLDDKVAFTYLERDAKNLRIASKAESFERWAREHIVILSLSDAAFDDANPLRLPAAGTPVPRSLHAKVVRELKAAGAKVIAFDFLFAAPRPPDAEFAAAARQSGNVVWACQFREGDGGTTVIYPVPSLVQASPRVGHINAPKDEEQGIVARLPVVKRHGDKAVPALAIVVAQMYLGLDQEPLVKKSADSWQCGDITIPVDKEDHFVINFFGAKAGEVFNSWPYERAYDGFEKWDFYKKNKNQPAVSLRGKIVLIGDTTTLGHDVVLTPLKEMDGVEVHAHAVATILRDSFVRAVPPWVDIAVLCLLTGLTSLIAANWRSTWALLGSAFLLSGYVGFNVWMFVAQNIELRMVAPCAAIIMATLLVATERNLTVERAANHTRALLQRYVSPQIANYILAHPEKAALGGTRETVTVLFSDIRGFTAMSEKLAPEEVLSRLNEYLQAMTDVVHANDGMVDKYIGDAVMALFGVPLKMEDHALKAVATALGMQEALLALQERWRAEGLPMIDIGIGINTGELVFGNMGANERRDFSVLGDTVNTASRVESLNKEMGSRILITAATYQIVADAVRARGPLTAHVKGKEEPVTVYEIFGWQKDRIEVPE